MTEKGRIELTRVDGQLISRTLCSSSAFDNSTTDVNCRVVAGERIGAEFDEEIDLARRAISRAQCLAYLVYSPRLL